ncbi:MAG: hypothetical protein LBB26_02890 [Puniceicoccales bacterium]|jgi:hypothetical protein|nr:hypothetical protein [Puniceicoccales bacterium]
MAIQVITLRKAFGGLFDGKNIVDYGTLCQMMAINDSFNKDAYATDASFRTQEAAIDNYEHTLNDAGEFSGFVLYSRTTGSGGMDVWSQVINPDARIPSSVELYLKRKGFGTAEGYVQVYALRQLDLNNFLITGTDQYRSYYADITTRIAGALYALSCYQKKLMELHIHDIEAVNIEQMEVNRILSLLTSMKNDLTQKDVGVTAIADRNTMAVDPDILAFFSIRGLLDNLATQGRGITNSIILALRRILVGEDTSGTSGKPNDLDSVAAFIRDHENDARIWDTPTSPEELYAAFDYFLGNNSPLKKLSSSPWLDQSRNEFIPKDALNALQTIFRTKKVADELQSTDGWSLRLSPEASLPLSLFGQQDYSDDDYDEIRKFLLALKNSLEWYGTQNVAYYKDFTADSIATLSIDDLRNVNIRNTLRLLSEATKKFQESEENSDENNDFSEIASQIDIEWLRYVLSLYYDVGYATEAVDATGDFTLNLIDSFKAWVYLYVLLKHYGTFFNDKRATIDGTPNCDVYDPRYWKKASEDAENARKGMAGVGDHWIYLGDRSVRWFGSRPPAGAEDFEEGIAGALARKHGGTHFIDPKYFRTNYSGKKVFTEEFKTKIQTPETSFAVVAVSDTSYPTAKKYFYVDFENLSPPNKIADGTVSSSRNAKSGWPIGGMDAYADLLVASINTIGGNITLTGEDCVFWDDSLSIYTSQISSLSSERLSSMQMALQSAQQSLNMGTNLSKSMARARLETIGNLR